MTAAASSPPPGGLRRVLTQLGKLLSLRFLAIFLTLVQTIFLTRVFGSETFGQLSFALSIGALAVLFLSAGLDQVMMRDIARHGIAATAGSRRWHELVRLTLGLVGLLGILLPLGGLVLVLGTDLAGTYRVPLIGVLLMVPVLLLRKFAESILLGAKQVARSILGTQIAYPALMVAGAGLVWLAGLTPGAGQVTVVYVIASLGSLALALILARQVLVLLRQPAAVTGESPGRRALLVSGSHFAFVSLGFVIGQHIDVLLVGILADPHEVALVRIAARVAEMAGLVRAIAILQYKPQMAETFGRGDRAGLQRQATTLAIIFTVTGLPITLGLWIFAEQAMGVFGAEFSDGAWAMRIYVLGVFFTMVCGPCNVILTLCDQERAASRILWVALAVNFGLDLALIPWLGVLGCAIANMSSMLVLGLASVVVSRRSLGLDTTILSALGRLKRG